MKIECSQVASGGNTPGLSEWVSRFSMLGSLWPGMSRKVGELIWSRSRCIEHWSMVRCVGWTATDAAANDDAAAAGSAAGSDEDARCPASAARSPSSAAEPRPAWTHLQRHLDRRAWKPWIWHAVDEGRSWPVTTRAEFELPGGSPQLLVWP